MERHVSHGFWQLLSTFAKKKFLRKIDGAAEPNGGGWEKRMSEIVATNVVASCTNNKASNLLFSDAMMVIPSPSYQNQLTNQQLYLTLLRKVICVVCSSVRISRICYREAVL